MFGTGQQRQKYHHQPAEAGKRKFVTPSITCEAVGRFVSVVQRRGISFWQDGEQTYPPYKAFSVPFQHVLRCIELKILLKTITIIGFQHPNHLGPLSPEWKHVSQVKSVLHISSFPLVDMLLPLLVFFVCLCVVIVCRHRHRRLSQQLVLVLKSSRVQGEVLNTLKGLSVNFF